MAPPPPELIDDAFTEILLRLPPDDPACLVRVSLVCKLWRRILSDPTFPHRYREFHRTPPLLGFYTSKASRFVPISTRTPFLQPAFGCWALDCRHGRVLFDMHGRGHEGRLAVWDPITGDNEVLREPDPDCFCHSGAVLCAAAGCNHRGCHGGPFLVVFVSSSSSYADGDHTNKAARAWVYSTEAAAWSAPASVQIPDGSFVERKRAAIIGDQIYFLLSTGDGILKYDLGKQCLTKIGWPGMYDKPVLMTMEDGSLGFVGVKDSWTLHLWTTKVNPNGSMGWVQDRVILVNNLVPVIRAAYTYGKVNVIGFAEGVDIILLGEDASGFMFELKSGQFRKISNPEYQYYDVFPCMSFYVPACARGALPSTVGTQ